MTIHRIGDPTDAAWLGLRNQLWPAPMEEHRAETTQVIDSGGVALLAVLADQSAVGFAEVSVRTDYVPGVNPGPVPYLEGWLVQSAWQGKGIGRALIDAACLWAKERGFTQFASDAELANESGQGAHVALGFEEVSRIVNYVRKV